MMPKHIIYVRRDRPFLDGINDAFWIFVGVIFLAVVIGTLFFTIPLGYHTFIAGRKQHHVHTNSHPH